MVPNEQGRLIVFRALPEFEMVADLELGDGVLASPVICGDQIFLRTETKLICLRNAES